MKTKLITILMLLSSVSYCLAQKGDEEPEDTTTIKIEHEIGIGVTNILKMPSYDDITNYYFERYSYAYPQDANGGVRGAALTYKLHALHGAFRIALNYAADHKSITTSRTDTGGVHPVDAHSDFTNSRFQAGYQYGLQVDKTTVCFGLDFFIDNRKYESSSTQHSKYNGLDYTATFTQKDEDNPTGISLFMGFNYRFSELISCTVESCLDFYSYTTTEESGTIYDPIIDPNAFSNSSDNTRTRVHGTAFRPFQVVTLNIHFPR